MRPECTAVTGLEAFSIGRTGIVCRTVAGPSIPYLTAPSSETMDSVASDCPVSDGGIERRRWTVDLFSSSGVYGMTRRGAGDDSGIVAHLGQISQRSIVDPIGSEGTPDASLNGRPSASQRSRYMGTPAPEFVRFCPVQDLSTVFLTMFMEDDEHLCGRQVKGEGSADGSLVGSRTELLLRTLWLQE